MGYHRGTASAEVLPGVLLVLLAMAIGSPSVTFVVTTLLNSNLTARLSTHLQKRKLPFPGKRTSISRRLMGLAATFGLVPTFWIEGMAYVHRVRDAAHAASATIRPSQDLVNDLVSAMATPVIFTMIFVYFTARSIVRPVTMVADTLEGIARKGTAVGAERVPILQQDEVGDLVEKANLMIDGLEAASEVLEEKRRLEQELELGARLQTSILPRDVAISRLEVATRMHPATEVGGDYFDLLPFEGGAWIGIGDVAGHGVTAGIVMMMVQSVISSLCRAMPDASPMEILAVANGVLYENIRTRLDNDEHVTFSLLRWTDDGKIRMAGAHEDVIVWRAKEGACELVATEGPWLAGTKDIRGALVETELVLAPGDLVVLYTDGITEAGLSARKFYGMDRLVAAVERLAPEPVEVVCERIVEEVSAFTKGKRDDDQTLVVFRYTPPLDG